MPSELLEVPSERGADGRRAFVVVGMHRSGTSAMTRTLSLLGAALPHQLLPAAGNNPSGFWEPQAIVELNDEILQAQDSEWDDVFAFRERQYLSNFDRFYLGRAIDLLDQEFNGAEVIVLKDPRISVLTAFWDRALHEAGYTVHYVIMVRNPLEVAQSLHARDGFPREKSFLLWSSYMIAVDRDTRNRARTFVSFDQLLNDWRGVRRRIEAKTGVPFPRDSAACAIEIDRHLDGRLRHHTSSSDDLFARSEVPEQVKTIYRIFAGACEGKSVDGSALEAIAAELSKMDQLVGPLLADLKLSVGRSVAEMEIRTSSLESERSRLCSEIELKQRQVDELVAQIGAAETARAQLASEKALLLEQLRERDQELVVRKTESESLAERLAIAEADLESAKGRLEDGERRIDELVCSLGAARSASSELEQRLTAHFHETTTLSKIILECQQSTAKECEKARRIRQLYDAVISQPWWWSVLSRTRRSRLQTARLRRLGLFDGQAYLRENPDVAAAGEDPLHHYLHHGIDEHRPLDHSW